MSHFRAQPRRLQSVARFPMFAALAMVCVPASMQGQTSARIKPLFELFATLSAPPLAPVVRDVYAAAGGVRSGGGVGVAAGVLVSRVEIAAFYEAAIASIGGPAQANSTRSFGRNALGLRLEAPIATLPDDFHLLASASVFQQKLERVLIPAVPAAPAPVTQRAWGGRAEGGVEHRGFIGTTWFVTGGVTFATAGSGGWEALAASSERGGIGVQPIATIGLRTRGWW